MARELTWRGEMAQGANGGDVKRLQEWLCLRGFRTGIDEDFGPATAAQVRAFQRSLPVEPTGRADTVTLAALCSPLRMAFGFDFKAQDLRSEVLAVAKAHLVSKPLEVGGDNRGPWVRAYCGHDGKDWAWCAGCDTSILQQAALILGVVAPIAHTLGCDEIADLARRAGRLTRDAAKARAGDLFLLRSASNPDDRIHTGIVAKMGVDHVETFEGNTNDDGSANGYEFVPRTRGLRRLEFVLLG